LKTNAHLYHSLGTKEGLEASVLKLRDDLTRLRRGVRRWAVSVAVLLSRAASCLRAQENASEAKVLAQRAADGARKTLGPEYPDTKKYEQLREELFAKQD
jgi:hypothetical protein